MRCGIISLLHESNTFLADRTTLADFTADVLTRGEGVRERFEGSQHEIGGFFEGLKHDKIIAVGVFAARALPYGIIERETFERLVRDMLEQLDAAGPLDGILVAPHGATVAEGALDADGHWLGEIRRRIGPQVPLIGTIDPHANLSPEMVAACDALIAYRTNPHIDQRQRGIEAAKLIAKVLKGEARPTMAAAYPPVAMSIECQATDEPPCNELSRSADEMRRNPGVHSASIVLGFPYADVGEMGSATIVVTENDVDLARRSADSLAAAIWQRRQRFVGERVDIDAAIARAASCTKPVCLLDMGDNVGGGSPGDATWIAKELHAQRVQRALVVICDGRAVDAAQKAGVGQRVALSIGGQSSLLSGPPLNAEFTVSGLFDGKFKETQPTHGGFTDFDQGPTALLTTDDRLTVMATSRRMVPFSVAQLTSCGLDPASFHIIVAKGVNAPIAAYSTVCQSFIRVDSPGFTAADMTSLNFTRRRRPMFPFEPDVEWTTTRAEMRMCRT